MSRVNDGVERAEDVSECVRGDGLSRQWVGGVDVKVEVETERSWCDRPNGVGVSVVGVTI